VLRRGIQVKKTQYYYISWIVIFQKQRQMRGASVVDKSNRR